MFVGRQGLESSFSVAQYGCPVSVLSSSFISGQSTLLLIFINGDVNVVFGVFGLYALCYRQH